MDAATGRARPAGIAADIAKKLDGKRSGEQEEECLTWMEGVLGDKLSRSTPYDDLLKDGVVLCNVINKLRPGSVKKIHAKGGAFVLMQNIEAFQKGMISYGVPKEDLFQTVDLWDKKNIAAVTKAIYALGRTAQQNNYAGPVLGPKLAEQNVREFDEATLRAGEGHIGLQAGYNKGATQAGLNMGKGRAILD